MNKEDIGKRIKTRRKENGLSQKELAELLHVSLTTVSKWETGVNLPDILVLDRIADTLKISITDLLGLKGCVPDKESSSAGMEPTTGTESSAGMEPTIGTESSAGMESTTGTESSAGMEPTTGTESSAEEEAAARVPASVRNDIPKPQPAPCPGEVPAKALAKWQKYIACMLSLIFAGIVMIGYFEWEKNYNVFSPEIRDEYYGEYEGEKAYYVIAEFVKEPTEEDILEYCDIFRKEYERYFTTSDMIVVVYVEDYPDFQKNGFDEETDILSVLFPY